MNTYQIVTECILRDLRAGIIPWHRPYSLKSIGALNYVSRKPYSFLNRLLLGRDGEFITENQLLERGGSFAPSGLSEAELDEWAAARYSDRQMENWWNTLSYADKDQKYQSRRLSRTVTFFKNVTAVEENDNEDGATEERIRRFPILKLYNVYSLDDTVGVPSKLESSEQAFSTSHPAGQIVEQYCRRTGVSIVSGPGLNPSYSLDDDTVRVPSADCFRDENERLVTLFSLLVRSALRSGRAVTSAPRDLDTLDLAAEMGASMICVMLELDTEEVFRNQTASVGRWISRLGEDCHLITRAAAAAEKAAAFVLNDIDD